MGADVRLSADGEQYELGAEINGTWVPFITRPATDVAGIQASVDAAANAAGGGTTAPGGGGPAITAPAAAGGTAGDTGGPSNAELQAEVDALRERLATVESEVAPPAPPAHEG